MRDCSDKLSIAALWLVVSASLALFGFSGESAQLEICNVGCNYASINEAIKEAESGDTLFIGAGTYRENLTVDKSLVLNGTNQGEVLINPQHEGRGLITVGPSEVEITLKNITISGAGGPASNEKENVFPDGVVVKGNSRLTLRNVIISANKKCGIRILGRAQVDVLESSIANNGNAGCLSEKAKLYINDSRISSNGLILSGSTTLSMVDSTVSNHHQVGLNLTDTSLARIKKSKVGTCEICLLVTDNAHLNIEDSTVSDAGDGIRLDKSSSAEVHGSEFTDCTSAIDLRTSSRAEIGTTKITNNDHGVSLFGASVLKIQGCRIAFNDLGIRVDPGSEAKISGCDIRFYNNFEKDVLGVKLDIEESLQDRCKE